MMQLQIHQQMCQPTRRCVRKTCTVGVIPAGCLQHSRHVRCRAAGQEASAAASGAGAGNTPAAAAVAAAQAGSTKKPSANQQCCDILANISITIIGDDTELNWEVCKALSKRIGWFPTSTAKVLQGLHKVSSVAELEQKLGAEGLGEPCRATHWQHAYSWCTGTSAAAAAAAPDGAPAAARIFRQLVASTAARVEYHQRSATQAIMTGRSRPRPNPWLRCDQRAPSRGWFASTYSSCAAAHILKPLRVICLLLAVKAEAEVLKGLSKQFRICVATLGNGASSQSSTYPSLYGSCIVWLGAQGCMRLSGRTAAASVPPHQQLCWQLMQAWS
jgi:hypothetical protein